MKRTFTILIGLCTLMVFSIACESGASLQKYYVDSKESSEFISIDLPSSILSLKDGDISEEMKKTLESIKKVNFLALQLTETNHDLFDEEMKKVIGILKKTKYKELIRFGSNKNTVSVNYLGEEDAIDEVVIFASDNQKGFILARVLGENMNPAEILKLTQEMKLDKDNGQFGQLEALLKNIN